MEQLVLKCKHLPGTFVLLINKRGREKQIKRFKQIIQFFKSLILLHEKLRTNFDYIFTTKGIQNSRKLRNKSSKFFQLAQYKLF